MNFSIYPNKSSTKFIDIYFIIRILAAIAAEKKIQRDTIRKQRDDYKRRATALKRELITLKEQREELVSGNEPPSPTTNGFIKENDRLQVNTNPIANVLFLFYLSCNISRTYFSCLYIFQFVSDIAESIF